MYRQAFGISTAGQSNSKQIEEISRVLEAAGSGRRIALCGRSGCASVSSPSHNG